MRAMSPKRAKEQRDSRPVVNAVVKGLPTCVYVYLGMFLAVLVFDVLAVGVAVVTRHDPEPRVVQAIEVDR